MSGSRHAVLSQYAVALRDYAEEALFEAEHNDQAPLAPDEVARVRELVLRSLRALWAARRTR